MVQQELISLFVNGHFRKQVICGKALIYHGQLLYQSHEHNRELIAMWADTVLLVNDDYFYNKSTRNFKERFISFMRYEEIKKKLYGTVIRGYLMSCLSSGEMAAVNRDGGYVPYERRSEIAKKLLIKSIGGMIQSKSHYVSTVLKLPREIDDSIKSMPVEKLGLTAQEVLVSAIVDSFTMNDEDTGFFRVLRSIDDRFAEIVNSAAVAKMIKSAGGES